VSNILLFFCTTKHYPLMSEEQAAPPPSEVPATETSNEATSTTTLSAAETEARSTTPELPSQPMGEVVEAVDDSDYENVASYGVAAADYTPTAEGEVELHAGDVVALLAHYSNGWAKGMSIAIQ
jgi:hypothetical protein